jgi:predicted membrane metal-binding protein
LPELKKHHRSFSIDFSLTHWAIFFILAIGIYTIFVGASPPVLRAASLGIVSIRLNLIGRRIIGNHMLALTACLHGILQSL